MPNDRALPTVIGPTENALRALLHQALGGSPISGYPQWVAMSVADATGVPVGADLTVRLAGELKGSESDARDHVRRLVGAGLLRATAAGHVLTEPGEAALREGRRLVRSATSRLTDGIAEGDIEVTVRTLDRVRANAERELLRPGPGE